MKKQASNEFKDAEAVGHIKTMPEHVEPAVVQQEKEEVVGDPETFRMAVARAQMDNIDRIVVTKKVMQYLLRGHKGNWMTYGDPAVLVIEEGFEGEFDHQSKLTAEKAHEEYVRKMTGR